MTSEEVRTGRSADRVAMVTGAASGIGAAVARQLAAEGARAVVLADVNGDGAAAVAEEPPAARALALDVTDAAGVDGAVQDVLHRYGRLDILVHAAGVDDPEAKQRIADAAVEGRPVELTDSLDDASWQRVLRVNLDRTSSARCCSPTAAGSPPERSRPHPDPGRAPIQPARSWRRMVLPAWSPMPTVMN
ncbi:SDR family NAD(P)-dependent oxidoreductase [Streptomyces sp. NPDC056697]|uniref:SDR family NAD(P)-dependent oxidoreductase n=1 Tax=Streptomyces sp. NPDC056697 TaxID=3345915 RepID=UPI0036C32473